MNIQRDGASFIVQLSHVEVETLNAAGGVIAAAAPEIAPIIGALAGIVTTVDFIGGKNGVEISGAIGSTNLMILPQGKGILGTIVRTVSEVASFLVNLQPGVVLAKFGIKIVGGLFGSPGGSIHANEGAAKNEETFLMITTTDNKVAFIAFRGYFHASSDDSLLWANRDKSLRDEKFDLIRNANGTITLRSWMNTYVCADRNKGKRMTIDRKTAGEWEQFHLEFLGGGKVALQDSEGKYVSVAP
jgi:hypothetical protein